MIDVTLTPEQEEEAERIVDQGLAQARVELKEAARLIVSKKNSELFGETEFLLRDAVHRIASRTLDAALQERKKRGTKGRPSSARIARPTPGSLDIADVSR
jgi:hypothetical protein